MNILNGFGDFLTNIGNGIATAASNVLGWFSYPSNTTALVNAKNNIDKINADFELEQMKQGFQFKVESAKLQVSRQNTIDTINASFELEQYRQRFQAEVENVKLQVGRQNTIDRINADFELEIARQQAEKHNIAVKIEADFQLEAMREQFQHQMENRRQEFEVKKLQAQFLNQYNLQKDEQNFQVKRDQTNFEYNTQLAKLGAEYEKKLQEFREEWENLRLSKKLEFETRLFEERRKLEWELKQFDRETEVILANAKLKNTLQSNEYTKIIENHPLIIQTTPTLDFYKQYQDNRNPVPPLIIISPPILEFDEYPDAAKGFFQLETRLTDKLRVFLHENYPLHDSVRPSKFLGNAYKTKRIGGEAAIEILFWTHRSIPVLLIESKVDADIIQLYVATWNAMDEQPFYRKILSFSWKEMLYPFAKRNAQSWKKIREELAAEGKSQQEIEQEGGDDEYNLNQLLAEERDKKHGINRMRDYKVNSAEYTQALAEFLGFYHCILSGLLMDSYYISNYCVPPKLPKLLPHLLEKIPAEKFKEQLVEMLVGNYRLIYQTLEVQIPSLVPELALDLAFSFAQLTNKKFATEQVLYSVIAFLKMKGSNNLEVINDIEQLKAILLSSDENYFDKLEFVLRIVDKTSIPEANKLLEAWFQLVREGYIKRKRYGNTLY